MGVMFAFFALWFFRDGYTGYREKNAEVVIKQVFLGENESPADKADFAVKALDKFNENEYTPESWEAFACEQWVSLPENKSILPRDYVQLKWPEEIVKGYDSLKKSDMYSLWKAYSQREGLPIEPNEKIYDEDTINNQFVAAVVAVALLLVAIFISLRIMSRSMKVSATGYSPPGGAEIPFSAMRKIDKRKWEGKGLAFIHHEEDGKMKKAKVDGMVYGHFKPEDGAPAEVLFSRIMDNFKGEVIEFIDEEEEEENSGEKV